MANETAKGFCVLDAATGKEMELAMQRLWVRGRILPAGARLLVEHVFRAGDSKKIEAVYSFALPRDAALRRFTIRGERFAVHSQLKPTKDAIRTYEEGITKGSLSALARQHGDGVINLTACNIRPGETVTVTLEIIAGVESHDDGFRFRFPFTLAPGYHRRARMLEVAPGVGEMELPEDEFGDVLLPTFRKDASDLHGVGFHLRVDCGKKLREIGSPSHALRVRLHDSSAQVELSKERDLPDRDLVLEVKRAVDTPEVVSGTGNDGRRHFVAIIPSTAFGPVSSAARRIMVVLDRSGSMQGLPIQQARKAIEAGLGALEPTDYFGIMAFDDVRDMFQNILVPATKDNRDKARQFLNGIDARGGTELSGAIDQAAVLLGGGDMLVITDGQVMGTEHILATARAKGVRLHTLGIGSASQDRFLSLLARETGGVSRFVTAQERIDLSALDMFASIGYPAASNVEIAGASAPRAVFPGTPLVALGRAVGSHIDVHWSGGKLQLPLTDQGKHAGETVRLLYGARLLTDLDSRGETARLREVSEEYGLASKEMSLVAVVERESDRPGELPETVIVPVGMPQDTQFDSYFAAATGGVRMMAAQAPAPAPAGAAPPSLARLRKASAIDRLSSFFSRPEVSRETVANTDPLFEVALAIQDDGGIRGPNTDERVRLSTLALLYLLQEGHSSSKGAFRAHVLRLMKYVESMLPSLDASHRGAVEAVILDVKKERARPGNWAALWNHRKVSWSELGSA
jgi:Ca-activated chloride channel family protein